MSKKISALKLIKAQHKAKYDQQSQWVVDALIQAGAEFGKQIDDWVLTQIEMFARNLLFRNQQHVYETICQFQRELDSRGMEEGMEGEEPGPAGTQAPEPSAPSNGS